ncbi:unnamed protein product [Echinostoma caproni]|uniref:Tubulin-folding cofactor D C-terminal domain-containing protein n=1 Tax=Echinostoma caproni TaxID=27848 RepID=A0A3P8GY67_9TREM|nr:unnamed protein product [Echinostoma caproni]
MLLKAVCHLIEKSSAAGLPLHGDPVVETWRLFLDNCVGHKELEIQLEKLERCSVIALDALSEGHNLLLDQAVRETGMSCLVNYLSFLFSNPKTSNLDPILVEEIVVSIAQQAVEKIDRTRGVAGQAFADILHHDTGALTTYLLAHESDPEFIVQFLTIVEQISAQFASEERIVVPLFKFMDFLLNDPVITGALDGNSFGGMLQFDGPVRKRAANLMMILMAHRYPVVRKSSATKLYECLLVFDFVEPDVMDQITTLLTETIWESELTEVRPIRNTICELLGLSVPRMINPKSTPGRDTPTDRSHSAISVNGDAGDRA